jgi:hypothetical protein
VTWAVAKWALSATLPADGDLARGPSRPMVTVLALSALTKGERPR